MSINFNNEVTNRDLVEFNWSEVFKKINNKSPTYENIRNSIIADMNYMEESNSVQFQINDIEMAIPPLHIGINKENLEYSWKTLRSKASTKVFSNSGVFNVQLTLLFPKECILQLHRLVLEIRNNPFVCIKNKYLSSSLNSTDYHQIFKVQNTNVSGTMLKSTHFAVTNLQCVNYQASPGAFLLELDLRIFNTIPYSLDLKYRHDLKYLLPNNLASTMNVFFEFDLTNATDPLRYTDRIISASKSVEQRIKIKSKSNDEETNETTNISQGYLNVDFEETQPTFGVEYPYESCIYVKYYNYLQVKHLYLNFNINVEELLRIYADDNSFKVTSLDGINFTGFADFFNIGLYNELLGNSYRVLSIASKYLPLDVRNDIIKRMLDGDDTFTLMYESYITLNLSSDTLKKLRKVLMNDIDFSDSEKTNYNYGKLQNNLDDFKKTLNGVLEDKNETGNDEFSFTVLSSQYTKTQEATNSEQENIKFSRDEMKKILGYISLTSQYDFAPDYSSFIERRVNVFSTVEVINLAAAATEDNRELTKLLQLKPLVVTSCSAMLTNSLATIPIAGHTYPTYQFLGSHEPVYQMTFAASSFGNDPENLDDLPKGIQNIEAFRYEMEHNIQNFKQVPNAQAFSLNCFITKLFDSYRVSDINIQQLDSTDNEKPLSRRLAKKRLSINAINTQTLEGSPGTTVGSLRFTETNNYDLEKLQLVYDSSYEKLDKYAENIYKLAKNYCNAKESNQGDRSAKFLNNMKLKRDDKKIKEILMQFMKDKYFNILLKDSNDLESFTPDQFQVVEVGEDDFAGIQYRLKLDYDNLITTNKNELKKILNKENQVLADLFADENIPITNFKNDIMDQVTITGLKDKLTASLGYSNRTVTLYRNDKEKEALIAFDFNKEDISPSLTEEDLSYLTKLIETEFKPGTPEYETNLLLTLICNFNLLVSSLLIEPQYYLDDTELVEEYKQLNKRFYKLFQIEAQIGNSVKPPASPSYMRFLRLWLINSDLEKEGTKLFSIETALKDVVAKEGSSNVFSEQKYFEASPENKIIASLAVGSAGTLIGYKFGWLATGFIIGASIGIKFPNELSDVKSTVMSIDSTNAQKVRQFFNKNTPPDLDKIAANIFMQDNRFIELIYNKNYGIDIEKVKEILSKDELPNLINFAANRQDTLSDIASNINRKILNLNPIIHLYSQTGTLLGSDIANAVIQPDNETSAVQSLIFNGFEQNIFAYLYWFPKQYNTLIGINILSSDDVYFGKIFDNPKDKQTLLRTKSDKKDLYLDRNDNLKNLMIRPEWSLTFQYLQENDIDSANRFINTLDDKITISSDEIKKFKDERQNKDYLIFVCKKDKTLREKIKIANRNRIAYLEQLLKNLLIKLLHNTELEGFLKSLENGGSGKTTSGITSGFDFKNEVNGFDVSGMHCYQDIDLPNKPLTNGKEKLNPGFFYFDNNKEIYTKQQIRDVKNKNKKVANALLEKSDKFMNALKNGQIYTGNDDRMTILELGKSRIEVNQEKKAKGVQQTADPETKKRITIQDASLIDFQEGGLLQHLYEVDINSVRAEGLVGDQQTNNPNVTSQTKNIWQYTHPALHIPQENTYSEDGTYEEDIETPEFSSRPLDPVYIPYEKNQNNYQKVVTETVDGEESTRTIEVDDEITKEFVLKSNNTVVEEPEGDGSILPETPKIQRLIGDATLNTQLITNGDLHLDPHSGGGLFYASNFSLLNGNDTELISNDKIDQYTNFLKNCLYSDGGTPSKDVILNSLENQLGFTNKRTINQMYPTFKFYIIEEDAVESENPLVFDDFYNYNAVKDITVYKNRKLPADTAVIRLQNVSGTIDGSKPTGLRDIDYEMASVDDSMQQEELGMGRPEIEVNSVLLRPGVSAQLRMGYDSNPNNLEVMLSGKISDINWSSNGDMCEIVLQSFGVELLAKKIGTETDGIAKNFVFKNTDSILKFMIHQSDLQHFGRFKNKNNLGQLDKKQHLSMKIGNPKIYEKTWLQSIKSFFEENSIATTVGITIAGTALTFLALKFPSVARGLTRVGTFINQSKFITAISLGANKLFFRGFGASITDDVVSSISASVANASIKTTTTTKLEWLKQILTPTWAGWFMGNVNRFRDLATKVGYNQALLRILTSTDAAAVAATTIIKNKGVVSIFLNSFFSSVFKTYITLKLASLTLGLTAELISTSLDAFGKTIEGLIGKTSDEMSKSKKILLSALKDPRIMLSPMDDCIFPPVEANYICPIDAEDVRQAESSDTTSSARKRFAYTSRVVIAETANTIIDIFLKSWAFGSLVDIPFGFLEYRFKVTPYSKGGGSVITFENSRFLDQLTKNPYAAADKRLYEAYQENEYQIYNKTIWECVEEMTLRHPGWVAAARPYGLGPEYRLFFGMPNSKYYKKEISGYQSDRLTLISKLLLDNGERAIEETGETRYDYRVKTTLGTESNNLTQLIKLSSSKTRRNSKLIYKEIKRHSQDSPENADSIYAEYLKREIIKDFKEVIGERITTFRKYHYLNTDTNIVSCNIAVNDKAVNTVKVNYLHSGEDPTKNAIYTRTMQAHPYIPDDAINEASWNESNVETIQCKGFGAALRYGMTLLINGAKEMYDGEVITIGNPSINPFDIILLEDKVNGVSGPIEVEAVTHMFSFETGFLTEIKPNALVTGNEAMTYSVTSTAPVFLATEQVVRRVSNRGYANGKPGEKREIDDTTKNEIRNILKEYFSVPNQTIYNSFLGYNKPNFWYDYVDTSAYERLFKSNSISNQQLKQITTAIESAVFENIIRALESNRIDTLVNMKQGLFQLPEQVNQIIRQVNEDVFNVGVSSAIVGGAVTALATRFPVETLSKGWVINSLGFLKNSGKLGAIVAVGSLVFGDQIESTIEEYMQNEGTLENVLGLTQETRFAKINDGTLLQLLPLYKNERALVGGGFQYIRQNEIWHNRFGAIYNDISDAALGYIQAKKELKARTSFLSDEELKEFGSSPLRFDKTLGVYLYNRYISTDENKTKDTDDMYVQTFREMHLSDNFSHGLLIDF